MQPSKITSATNTLSVPPAGDIAENKHPIQLQSGTELCDVRIGATDPALFYRIPIPQPLLVTVDFQEFSMSSSCALFLSPVDPHPTVETATWQLLSPEPRKQFCIHPADENYRVGELFLAVRYLESSGNAFIRLRVKTEASFMGMWLRRAAFPSSKATLHGGLSLLNTTTTAVPRLDRSSTANGSSAATSVTGDGAAGGGGLVSCSSLYIGHWEGSQRDGRGVCYYAVTDEANAVLLRQPLSLIRAAYERPYVAWSANSIPVPMEAITGAPLDEEGLSALSGVSSIGDMEGGWSIIPLSHEGVEMYDGEWVNGLKQGVGVYQWRDRSYVGEWLRGQRHGRGTQAKEDGSWYQGEWRDDHRHGHGSALLLPSRTVYTGEWVRGLREGEGQLQYPDGVTIYGLWRNDRVERRIRAEYPNGTRYEGDWEGDQRNGEGVLRDSSGCVHRSTWVRDKREGDGVIEFPDGVVFRGTWRAGVAVSGAYLFPGGDVYTGEWDARRMQPEGVGTCRSPDGGVYEGTWHAGKRDGFGVMTYADGARYEGGWQGDRRCGEGTLTDAEGEYVGSFEDDVRSGQGTQRSPDGSHYTGGWKNNYRAGHGVLFDAKANMTYEGVFLCDRLQAEGTARQHATNEHYEGTWLDGLQQGHGTQTLANGDVVRGVWHRGRPQDGTIEYDAVDGSRYVGEWRDNQRNGRGTQTNPDGSVYEGEWVADRREGRGRLTRANTETVECAWSGGRMVDGEGTVTFADGSVYVGDLVRGVPHGNGMLTYPDATVFKGKFQAGIYVL